jgi:succinate dehydrogenase/fumarate reductase flavoprotein subunit
MSSRRAWNVQRWDEEADVVVVGYGAAGATAAVRTAELGGEAIILEKQPEGRHTPSSLMGGAQIMVVSDVDKATRYLDRCAGGMIPEAVSRAWATKASTVLDWIGQVSDVVYEPAIGAEHPEFEGSEAVSAYGGQTGGLFLGLREAVRRTPSIRVRHESPATRLVRDGNGRVVGVEVASAGQARRIGAKQGVVLTCGGYEYDESMKINFLKAYPIHFYGNPGNTGDGVRMAQELGAEIWHMNSMIGRAIAHFELPDGSPLNCLAMLSGMPGADAVGYAITDKAGRRFANEHMQALMRHDFYYLLLQYDPTANEYPRNPCYWFFDQRRMRIGPPVATFVGLPATGYYDWSPDSEAEIARGWIARADSIEEAAAMAGVADPARAAQEVRDYNAACAAGSDPFGRPAETLVPLDEPPFYCMPLYPGGSNTSGGPRRNEHSQVLNVYGEPIPGLYAAGELGEPVGLLYPSNGGNISDCACFGQIAVEHALRGS